MPLRGWSVISTYKKCLFVVFLTKNMTRTSNIRRGFVSTTSSCWTTWTRCSLGLSATSTSTRSSIGRKETTSTQRTSAKQNERLLSILGRKSPEKINMFFNALDMTGQSHIKRKIAPALVGIVQNMLIYYIY